MTFQLPGAIPPAGVQAPPAAGSGKPPFQTVSFRGAGADFVRLCGRGALFQLLTFGFYRFWLATDIRRHLWSNTSIEGEPLEYTGRPRELLIGFLIALAIFVPINLAYFAISVEAERYKAFASIPLFLFYAMFAQFAVYRARRYRLTRTIWRGVRFWMSGSGWSYALRWLGWALVSALTLGLAYPWMRASLERYKLSNTYYGDLQGGFHGSAWMFFKRGLKYWLACLAPLALIIGGSLWLAISKSAASPSAVIASVLNPKALAISIGAASLWLLALPFIWPLFRALEWRWWASGVRFGSLELRSNVSGGQFIGIYVKMIFFGAVCAGLVSSVLGIAALVLANFSGMSETVASPANMARRLFTGYAGLWVLFTYIVSALVFGVVQRFFHTREMWRVIMHSLRVSHIDALDAVAARGDAANAIGEGLADGLDVAGF